MYQFLPRSIKIKCVLQKKKNCRGQKFFTAKFQGGEGRLGLYLKNRLPRATFAKKACMEDIEELGAQSEDLSSWQGWEQNLKQRRNDVRVSHCLTK